METLEEGTRSLVVPLEECTSPLTELYVEALGMCSGTLMELYMEPLEECNRILMELHVESLGERSWSLMERYRESLGGVQLDPDGAIYGIPQGTEAGAELKPELNWS